MSTTKPKSKAGQRVANLLEGIDSLASQLNLRMVGDDSKFVIDWYLSDPSSGKRIHGPFKSIPEVEDKLNSLYLATGKKQS